MSLDILIFLLLLLAFFQGFRKGFIHALFSLAGTLLGIILALKMATLVAGWLFTGAQTGSRWPVLVAFLIVFLAVVIVFRLLAGLVAGVARLLLLGLVNRLAGAVLQVFISSVMISAFLYLLTLTGVIPADTLANSWFYPRLSPLAPKVFSWLGQLLPFLQQMFQDFRQALNVQDVGIAG